jgi:hypothetical protein
MNATGQATSSNFGFLAKRYPQLERVGAPAERYFSDDPIVSLITLRRRRIRMPEQGTDQRQARATARQLRGNCRAVFGRLRRVPPGHARRLIVTRAASRHALIFLQRERVNRG